MNLYLIQQTINDNYDTFDSAVVAAKTAEEAQQIHPSGKQEYWEDEQRYGRTTWTRQENVTVTLIGKAIKGTQEGVILASFNAGYFTHRGTPCPFTQTKEST